MGPTELLKYTGFEAGGFPDRRVPVFVIDQWSYGFCGGCMHACPD